jgi:hypothetical protein
LDATFLFSWVTDGNFLGGSGLTVARPWMLIPSDVPVTLTVSLEGYEDWPYALGRGALRNAFLLRPGEELTLDIRLRPKQLEVVPLSQPAQSQIRCVGPMKCQ